jgi:site-specific DNA-methyltransferase (adenine-specific)
MSMAAAPYQAYKNLSPATERALRASIKRFGVLVPMVKDQHGNVLDGHQRARLASILGVECPSITRQVTDEDEAREIARTLNEDRRAMPKEQRLPVAQALREEGHSIRAIAGAVGVDAKTVRNDLIGGEVSPPERTTGLDGKTYPAKRASLDTTREGTAKRRVRIAQLAKEGHTSAQIGDILGMNPLSVKNAARESAIVITADVVMRKTGSFDVRRIIASTVENLESEIVVLKMLPKDLNVDPQEAREWASSLEASLTVIRRLLTRLRSLES